MQNSVLFNNLIKYLGVQQELSQGKILPKKNPIDET